MRAKSLDQVKKTLNKIPLEYRQFPTMKDFHDLFPIKKSRQTAIEVLWKSQVEGTPASIEALFNMIRDGKTDSAGFKYGLNYVGLSEEKLFEAYEYFCRGEVVEGIKYLDRKGFKI